MTHLRNIPDATRPSRAISAVGVFVGSGLAASVVAIRTGHSRLGYTVEDASRCYGGPLTVAHNHAACYQLMADHPGRITVAPYAFRVMTPWLARLSPIGTRASFEVLAAIAVAIMAVIGFDLAGERLGLLGVGLVWTSGAVLLGCSSPGLLDATTGAFLLGALWLAERRRWWMGAILLGIGVLNHELVLLGVVALVALAWPTHQWRAAYLAAPAAVVYIAVHKTSLVVQRMVAPYPLTSRANLHMVLETERYFGSVPAAFARAVVVSFALGWPLLVVVWRDVPTVWRRAVLLPGLLALASFPLVADWDRLLSLIAVIAVPATCAGVAARTREARPTE